MKYKNCPYSGSKQEKGLIWDPSHGSEEDRWQHDYINMYYEQKDKFDKKYLSK